MLEVYLRSICPNPTFERDWPISDFFHGQWDLNNRGSVDVHRSAIPSTPR